MPVAARRALKKRRLSSESFHGDNGEFSEYEEKKPSKRSKAQPKRSVAPNPDVQETAASASLLEHKHPVTRHRIQDPGNLGKALLEWYDQVHEIRRMPWRKKYDPTLDAEGRSQRAYEVWISEIMLQQTQVETVKPYYNKWMTRFPTIQVLAASDIDTVNSLWKGLGYYSRAARLLKGAKKIVEEYDGLFPITAKEMIDNIPGIGRYSAGAISSIAYNHREPVLDGNVTRLLSRILALHAYVKSKPALEILWEGATTIIRDADRAGDTNQALIELGSTVCKVRDPNCEQCPVGKWCGAYQESQGSQLAEDGDIEELCVLCEPNLPDEGTSVTRYPMKTEKKKAREETDLVNVICWSLHPGKGLRWFLLVRRPEKGLLAGLHEFPAIEAVPNSQALSEKTLQKMAQDQIHELLIPPIPPMTSRFFLKKNADKPEVPQGVEILNIIPAGEVLHVFSHIRKTYKVQLVTLYGPSDDSTDVSVPPCLNDAYSHPTSTKPASPSTKPKKNTKARPAKMPSASAPILKWVTEDEVEDANIGTGVLKIWKKIMDLS